MIHKASLLFTRYRHFILYCAIGIQGILVEMFTFWVVFSLWQQDKLVANFVSMLTSITHNFYFNSRLNFKTQDRFWHRYLIYLTVSLVGVSLSSAILLIGVDTLNQNVFIVKIASIVLIVFIQFNLNSRITFRIKDKIQNQDQG